MRQLLYTSRETTKLTPEEVQDLLMKARMWNSENGITGLLLHAPNGRFIQLVEGMEDDVNAVFARICYDDRHNNLSILVDQEVTARVFPNWEMGFADLMCADNRGIESYLSSVLGNDSTSWAQNLIPVIMMAAIHDYNSGTSLSALFSKDEEVLNGRSTSTFA